MSDLAARALRAIVVLFEPDVCTASVALCEQSALAVVHSGLRQSFVSPASNELAGTDLNIEQTPAAMRALPEPAT